MRYSAEERQGLLRRLSKDHFDVVVIGGGITGAAILRDATLRGLKTALLEKGDFASGTSSRSSKLVHGGLRYLEQFNLGLVFESTHERARLMRLARHIVRPLPFILPVFEGDRRGLFMVNAGLWLYDLLSTFGCYRFHRRLGRAALLHDEPLLRPEGLRGGVMYYDAATDDARLTLENIISGFRHGGAPVSYLEATGLACREGRVSAVTARDGMTGEEIEIQTNSVVCAAGPWTEHVTAVLGARGPRLRPTKGSHIVIRGDRFPLAHAVVMASPSDGRVMFSIPWRGATVVGTTDTDFNGGADGVVADRADCDYLLAAANHYFPSLALGRGDVVGTWSGLRPLIDSVGLTASEVSREHRVVVDPRGIVTIAGGKLTTYRLMAAEAVDAVSPFLPGAGPGPSITRKLPLPYASGVWTEEELPATVSELAARAGVGEASARHLLMTYGGETDAVVEAAAGDRSLLDPVVPGLPYLRIEVVHACGREMALTLEDVLCRRTALFFLCGDRAGSAIRDVAALMAGPLDWDVEHRDREIARVEALFDAHMACTRD